MERGLMGLFLFGASCSISFRFFGKSTSKIIGDERRELVLHEITVKSAYRIFAGDLSNVEKEFTKNVSFLKPGAYILSWTSSKGRITKKIMKL